MYRDIHAVEWEDVNSIYSGIDIISMCGLYSVYVNIEKREDYKV